MPTQDETGVSSGVPNAEKLDAKNLKYACGGPELDDELEEEELVVLDETPVVLEDDETAPVLVGATPVLELDGTMLKFSSLLLDESNTPLPANEPNTTVDTTTRKPTIKYVLYCPYFANELAVDLALGAGLFTLRLIVFI